ncbi:TetR/AcrR family transcriptional regulator [Nocardia gipuzkoensis]
MRPLSPRTMPRAARREQIIEAAREVIEEHGPEAFIGQIAERAGLARPNIYRHFAGKDELDLLVARSAYRELRASILARLDVSGTPIDVIRAPIAAQVSWAADHPNLYRFFVTFGYRQRAELGQGERGVLARELAAAAARYMPQFGEDAEVAQATMVGLIGLVDASVLHWLERPRCDRLELVEDLTAQAWLIFDLRLRHIGVALDPEAPLPTAPDKPPADRSTYHEKPPTRS